MSKTIYRIDAGIDGRWLSYEEDRADGKPIAPGDTSPYELADLLDDQFDSSGYWDQAKINEYCKYGDLYDRLAHSLVKSIGAPAALTALWQMAIDGGLPSVNEGKQA